MGRLRIDLLLDEQERARLLAEDVRRGLTATPKTLPPKYFYDAAGSDLFERITELPEYYLTRAEAGLLNSTASSVMSTVKPREIVELGAGSATKTRLLLDAAHAAGSLARYLPFDVSPDALRAAGAALMERYPFLKVHGSVGDFERHLDQIPPPDGSRLALLLGSTIGNLEPAFRTKFLSQVRGLVAEGGGFLLGVDLVKDVAALHAAYNDSEGVTAAFNRNVLHVVNRELGADFQPQAFQHHAFFNPVASRIEMHLVPRELQNVRIATLSLSVEIRPDESIWTESSYKFTQASTAAMLEEAGFELGEWYTDPGRQVGLALAVPR